MTAASMGERLWAVVVPHPPLLFAELTGPGAPEAADLRAAVADAVRERFFFYDWDASVNEVRWMCGFDTTEADVDAFAALVRDACAAQVGEGAPAASGRSGAPTPG